MPGCPVCTVKLLLAAYLMFFSDELNDDDDDIANKINKTMMLSTHIILLCRPILANLAKIHNPMCSVICAKVKPEV